MCAMSLPQPPAPRHNPTGDELDFGSGALHVFVGGEGVRDWERIFSAAEADGVLVEAEAYLGTGGRFAVGELDGDLDLELVLALDQPG